MNRQEQIDDFYELIEQLPIRYLKDVKNGDLPEKGVYFFFEKGEKELFALEHMLFKQILKQHFIKD
jgi:hypothetical protein